MQLGSPVKVLGEAIYDVSGLTFQGSLDKFWTGASKPDAALVRAFVGAMAGTVQIRGVFFDEPGLGAAVRAAVGRLYTGTAGTTQLSARVAQEAAASRPLSSNCR